MGIIDKIQFWKKDEDIGFRDDIQEEVNSLDPLPTDSISNEPLQRELKPDYMDNPTEGDIENPQSLMQKSNFESNQTPQSSKDLDLISSKLDTIKSELDSINLRIQKIEKIAEESQDIKPKDKLW